MQVQVLRLERDISQAQANQLRHAQSRGDGYMEHGTITDAESCGGHRVVEDGLALLCCEVVNQPDVRLLVGNGQHTVDLLQCAGDAIFNKVHERLDGGQPGIARTWRVAPHLCMANSYFINNIRRLAIAAFRRRYYPRTA